MAKYSVRVIESRYGSCKWDIVAEFYEDCVKQYDFDDDFYDELNTLVYGSVDSDEIYAVDCSSDVMTEFYELALKHFLWDDCDVVWLRFPRSRKLEDDEIGTYLLETLYDSQIELIRKYLYKADVVEPGEEIRDRKGKNAVVFRLTSEDAESFKERIRERIWKVLNQPDAPIYDSTDDVPDEVIEEFVETAVEYFPWRGYYVAIVKEEDEEEE